MLQIVASGLQDRERLNSPESNPSVSFYKSVMMKRTRWASQWRRVEFDGIADFGRTAICTLPIQGELITRATLVIDLPDLLTPQVTAINTPYDIVAPSWAWTNGIGHAICSDVQMLINDDIIDQFDSRLLEIIDEQERPVEHFDSTDTMLFRNTSNYSDKELLNSNTEETQQQIPSKLQIIFPFWWNVGPGPQPLPIQALWKEKVQLKVTFRPIQQCVFTSTRINPLNPPLSSSQGAGPMPNIAGCGFFYRDLSGQDPPGQDIYDAGDTLPSSFKGGVAPGLTMPTEYHFNDAYWIIEYVSLEDREAASYRLADMEIPIKQHIAMPVITTGGAKDVRIRMDQGGLVRDLTWVAQRLEATDYNAYFLFSRDLGPFPTAAPLDGTAPLVPVQSPCTIPWWPNAVIPDWNYGDGYMRPAFVDRRSDPILAAKMAIRGMTRFEHEGPSIFRSLIPILNCKRTPLIDRYIYRYDFGFWSTGGLAEALLLPADDIRGYSNWDKLPKRELSLTMNQDNIYVSKWLIDNSQTAITVYEDSFVRIDSQFTDLTSGFLVELTGAHPPEVDLLDKNGNGAVVRGIVDFGQIKSIPGYQGLYLRTNISGSASLVVKTSSGYKWIAVAGGGGYGLEEFGGGGDAGSAVEIAWQGGNFAQTHDAIRNADGIITLSNISPRDKFRRITQNDDILTNPPFLLPLEGIIEYIQLTFSLNKSTIPLVSIYITTSPNINQATNTLAPPITRYDFIAPISDVVIPEPIVWTLYSPETITIPANNYIMVNFIVNVNPNPNILNRTTLRTDRFADLVATVVVRTINSPFDVLYGGGGGGRNESADIGEPDGIKMPTTVSFAESHMQTGGTSNIYHGGDGYYGGGSGNLGGGGGGSFVDDMMLQVNTFEVGAPSNVSASLTPLYQIPVAQPNFNIYSWVTRYNRLRINSGRAALMFNDVT
jgi:hypothetical protein